MNADVTAVNVSLGLVMMDDGQALPITNLFDANGDDCAPSDAVTCVAGRGDMWVSIDLRRFERVAIQ